MATSDKRHALQTFQRNMSEDDKEALREATRNCQSVIDNAKREHWERLCAEKNRRPGGYFQILEKRSVHSGGGPTNRNDPSKLSISTLTGCKRRQKPLHCQGSPRKGRCPWSLHLEGQAGPKTLQAVQDYSPRPSVRLMGSSSCPADKTTSHNYQGERWGHLGQSGL